MAKVAFMTPENQWLDAHYNGAADKIVNAVGGVENKKILSVGCGEMLIEFGLLARGAPHVTGLDISPDVSGGVSATAAKLRSAGFEVLNNVDQKIRYVQYDGINFPFESGSFDSVFSWGAFEHVADVRSVLKEMRRVLRDGGRGMIAVYPWFPSYYGSHLSDYVEKPFFHLTQSNEWIKGRLNEYGEANPGMKDLVTRHMWQEFQWLNKCTADQFYKDFRSIGFSQHSWQLISYETDLTDAPNAVSFPDLMIAGSQVSFVK